MRVAENYKDLSRTVCINILNFKLLDNYRYHNAYLKWIEFIKEPESEAVRILELTDEIIRKAKNQLYKLSLDKKT